MLLAVSYDHLSVDVLDFNALINQTIMNINEFIDSFDSVIPYIFQSMRLTTHSKTLIGNIFWNVLICKAISWNITAATSGHLPQFFFATNKLSYLFCNKSNNLEKEFYSCLLWEKLVWNSSTRSIKCQPIYGILFWSYEFHFRYSCTM